MGSKAVTKSCDGNARTSPISRSRLSESSSAAGSSTISAAVGLPNAASHSSCPNSIAAAVSFCCPLDTRWRACLPSTRIPTSARCGPTWVVPRSASRFQLAPSASAKLIPPEPPVNRGPTRRACPGAARRRQQRAAADPRNNDAETRRSRFPLSINSGSQARTRRSRRLGRSQRRVTLFQRALVPTPLIDESWFHVEHSPVEIAPALLGTLLHQSGALRDRSLVPASLWPTRPGSRYGRPPPSPQSHRDYNEPPSGRARPPAQLARNHQFVGAVRISALGAGLCGTIVRAPGKKWPRADWFCPRRSRR